MISIGASVRITNIQTGFPTVAGLGKGFAEIASFNKPGERRNRVLTAKTWEMV